MIEVQSSTDDEHCIDRFKWAAVDGHKLKVGEESELDLADTEMLHPEYGMKTRVYYRGLPKAFVAGKVYDPVEEEVIIGGTARLASADQTWVARTDAFGDFWIRDVPDGTYTLSIQGGGKSTTMELEVAGKSIGLGNIPLS